MIVIRNMFMVKKLFVVSFLIFVMSLSSVFAMKTVDEHNDYNGETEEKENSQDAENSPERSLNNIRNSQSGEFFVPMDNNEKFPGNPMVASGSIDKKAYLMSQHKQITGQSQFLQGFNQPVQGYNQAVQGYYPNINPYYPNPNQNPYYQNSNNQDPNNQNPNNMYQVPTGMPPVYVDVTQQTIFGYRRVIFLFWSPLICNSLLNYIFELDNKPSGGFLGMFFSGWRSRTFLRFMSFDVHFNTVLFLASSFCDVFVYRSRSFTQRLKKNGVYFLLFDLVFNAFSLCVNFKVDDYFYITVNLS